MPAADTTCSIETATEVICEFVPIGDKGIAIARSLSYSSSLDHFDRLFDRLARAFPGVKREDVEVKQYGGPSFSRTYGLEVLVDSPDAPDGFATIRGLHFTL